MIATPVVRGRPLFRPRMVISALGPSGTPAANSTWRIGAKSLTCAGRRAPLAIRSLICVAPSCVDLFGAPQWHPERMTREQVDVTAVFKLDPSVSDNGEIQLAEPVRI